MAQWIDIQTGMKKWFFYFGFACWIASPQAKASVLWDFSGATMLPTLVSDGWEVSSLENVHPWGQVSHPFPVSSPSEGYPQASGGEHLGSAVKTGDLNLLDSTYTAFILSVTLDQHMLVLESVSFGSRSTSTGPQAYSLRWSLDGFATELASGVLVNDASWGFYSAALEGQIATPLSVEIRLYWFGGEGTAFSGVVNHRLDDLHVVGSLHAIPEPAAWGGMAMGMGVFLLKILHAKKGRRREK